MENKFINYLKFSNIDININHLKNNNYIKSVYEYYLENKKITFKQKIAIQNIIKGKK